MPMKIKRMNRGVALLWALVVIMVLLIVAGSMSGLIIKEMRMSLNIDTSEQVYAAARSGIEVGKRKATENCLLPTSLGTFSLDPDRKIKYTVSYQPVPGACEIESTGIASVGNNEITRKIKTTIKASYTENDIMSFPQEARNLVQLQNDSGTVPIWEFRGLESLRAINPSENAKHFYQQFDITVPPDGSGNLAGAGTVSMYMDGAISKVEKYFLVQIQKDSSRIPPGYDRLVLRYLKDRTSGEREENIDYLSQPVGDELRVKIIFDGKMFNVALFKKDSNGAFKECLTSAQYRDAEGYSFNKYAVYGEYVSSDGASDTGIEIARFLPWSILSCSKILNMVVTD